MPPAAVTSRLPGPRPGSPPAQQCQAPPPGRVPRASHQSGADGPAAPQAHAEAACAHEPGVEEPTCGEGRDATRRAVPRAGSPGSLPTHPKPFGPAAERASEEGNPEARPAQGTPGRQLIPAHEDRWPASPREKAQVSGLGLSHTVLGSRQTLPYHRGRDGLSLIPDVPSRVRRLLRKPPHSRNDSKR
ncbi:uncharacterized protein LOC111824168 [Myotis lucifugus]|uniref:uncharacterized protein LOC111824168 n=1 Tax=Myotis lucifugus TaxID=59463 RepID=UPI000CCC199C|nr:uncharacterized protein LOC111824168 [Myotis lucifugus]